MSSANNNHLFQTPPPKSRQQEPHRPSVENGSNSQLLLPKTLYLIRHAESEGQAAGRQGMDRRHDVRLRDCPLTALGVVQAKTIIEETLGSDVMDQVELVVTSPLTRALQTALLAFPPSKPVTVHYDLRELGSRVPENVPRKMSDVLHDLNELVTQRGGEATLDFITTQPPDWPRDYSPRVCRHDKIRNALLWFARRPERHIAVVCHFNVIRALLFDESTTVPIPSTVRPQNALPITTELIRNLNGQVVLRIANDGGTKGPCTVLQS